MHYPEHVFLPVRFAAQIVAFLGKSLPFTRHIFPGNLVSTVNCLLLAGAKMRLSQSSSAICLCNRALVVILVAEISSRTLQSKLFVGSLSYPESSTQIYHLSFIDWGRKSIQRVRETFSKLKKPLRGHLFPIGFFSMSRCRL